MDRYIRTIYNKANEMDRLLDELTLYWKIDTNRIPYTFNKINVREYFDDCVEEVGLDLESKNIELSYFNSVENDVLVIADAEQLKRVINNIVGNSIKYMDKPKGYISIRVKDVGDFVQVEIEDNGRGIAAKKICRQSLTGSSGRMHPGILPKEEVESVFPSYARSSKIMAERSGQTVNSDVVQ